MRRPLHQHPDRLDPEGARRGHRVRQAGDGRGRARVLARAHARSGDAVAIAAYLGVEDTFDGAIADYAEAYADLNQADWEAYKAAIAEGRVSVP